MSSFSIRDVREISTNPLNKFTNRLAKKLSKFINKDAIDKLENKEDIYSAAQDTESVIKFHSLNSTKYYDFHTEFYPPTEPDLEFNTVWIKGGNMGNTLRDISGFANHATIIGDPVLLDGTPFDYGINSGGTKSVCLRFNRPTSDLENSEFINIPDASNIRISGTTIGNSYFIRFRIHDLSSQAGLSRTIFEKVDDSTPDNAVMLQVSDSGSLRFIFKRGGTTRAKTTASGTVTTDTVYEVWLTYSMSGATQHVYVNNVDKSLSDYGGAINWHDNLANHDLSIFRRGSNSGGYVYGDFYDFMGFRDKVVSGTEVDHHYTNKWTLADIPFGQVLIANYWATYYIIGSSFTSTSFTGTSFDL